MTPFDVLCEAPLKAENTMATSRRADARPGAAKQRTVRAPVTCAGIGVHSGEKVTLRLLPSEADHGIVFLRTDLRNGARTIPARWDHVVDTQLCTVIGNDHGGRVATIEHLMAALRAAEIDNAIIEIDGPEVPVMDGSSDPFVSLIESAGFQELSAPRREIAVLKPVEVRVNGKVAALLPSDKAHFSFNIAFENTPIQSQSYAFTLSPDSFKEEIGRARTFGFFEDVDRLQKMGFARGGSLENAIVIQGDSILNEGGLRFGDEFVRHKLLDAVGDMALAGAPIRGHFRGKCSGHALNNRLLRTLFADSNAWKLVEDDSTIDL